MAGRTNILRPSFGGKLTPETVLNDLLEQLDELESIMVVKIFKNDEAELAYSTIESSDLLVGSTMLHQHYLELMEDGSEGDI